MCQSRYESIAKLRIGTAEVPDRTFNNVFAANLRKARCDVFDQPLLLLFAHDAVESARQNEVVVIAMTYRRVVSRKLGDFDRRPQRLAGLLRAAKAVGLVILLAPIVAIRAHYAIAAVIMRFRRMRPIDWQ